MKKSLTILGSTGSIGVQALEIAKQLALPVCALTAGSNAALLEEQIRAFRPEFAALLDEKAAQELSRRVGDLPTQVMCGADGIAQCAAAGAHTVLNAIVGIAGLAPTLCAINAGSDIALANKETLVAGGSLVTSAVLEKGVRLLPVDSEHSAIFQALQGEELKSVKRLILTASGGPFFGKSREELKDVTLADALKHPNWDMGAKITVDSATMFNKGLELIEAVRLFDVPADSIEVVIHRQSVVHSLVEYADNSVIAQMGVPDMKIPIQYALTYPKRRPCPVEPLSLTKYGTLTFHEPDDDAFPAIRLARRACAEDATVVYNGANEIANELFRTGKIGFLDITSLVEQALDEWKLKSGKRKVGYTLEDVHNMDKWARDFVLSKVRNSTITCVYSLLT
ncbi:MAG: 1-deoxy-D-xylulose-5-phosphate reductoisomerase [Oscillospiraceae bacterium]|nr:1-deoxy-D-xylulose-5-phosphate reductoisomerase [Oscillospiraceae bacterium]